MKRSTRSRRPTRALNLPWFEGVPYPQFAVWEITYGCNMSCRHCGSNAGGARRLRHQELTTDEAFRLCDELAELGNERITLSGGELFMRKDWDQIAARLQKNGIGVSLISNGLLVEKNLDRIARLEPLDALALSLDGTRQTHDFIRRVPGSFDRVVAALKALRRLKVMTAVITTLSRRNVGELQRLYDVLVDCQVNGWQLQFVIGEGRMEASADMPAPREIAKVSDFIVAKKRERKMQIMAGDNIGYCRPDDAEMRGAPWAGCHAGLLVVGIEADGSVKGCLSQQPALQENNPFVEGNVRDKSLREIWENPKGFSYNRQFDFAEAKGPCKGCLHLQICRCGCTATAYALHGSRYENRFCMVASAKEERRKAKAGALLRMPRPVVPA